jgi:hypothetical protein
MNIKDFLEIAVGGTALLGTVWHIAEIKTAIYRAIDASDKITAEKINSLSSSVSSHIVGCSERDEHFKYLFHALDEKISHKFNRLHQEQRELQQFLKKSSGYVVRHEDDRDE